MIAHHEPDISMTPKPEGTAAALVDQAMRIVLELAKAGDHWNAEGAILAARLTGIAQELERRYETR